MFLSHSTLSKSFRAKHFTLYAKGGNSVPWVYCIFKKEGFSMKTLWKVLACTGFFLALVFVLVKTQIVGGKLEQIARPSHLFSLQFIQSDFPQRTDWDARLSEDHDRFFYVVSQQSLRWISKGSVSFVFSTSDNKYVVKFINISRFKAPGDHGRIGNSEKHKKSRKDAKMEDTFQSARISFDELQEETGVVYVHLNRTKDKIHGLKLIDSYAQSQRVCGDDTCFIMQRQAKPVLKVLTDLMDKGEMELACTRVDQIFNLLISLARKGYVDGDDRLIPNNNIGFTDDRAIYIDTFHFFPAKHLDLMQRMQYECQQRLLPLERWLKLNYPELAAYYVQKRNDVLAAVTAEHAMTQHKTDEANKIG